MAMDAAAAEVNQPEPIVFAISRDISGRHVAMFNAGLVQELNLFE
jgi:hypothetical protein